MAGGAPAASWWSWCTSTWPRSRMSNVWPQKGQRSRWWPAPTPVEIPFPPSPYHRQRSTIPAFHGNARGLPLWGIASAGAWRLSAALSLWQPHHRIESSCGSPNGNGNRCHWRPRPQRVRRHRWLKPKHIGRGCHLARRFLRWRTYRTGTVFLASRRRRELRPSARPTAASSLGSKPVTTWAARKFPHHRLPGHLAHGDKTMTEVRVAVPRSVTAG